jgi:glycosyltransferase involved in cell wall biosynthesis
MFDPSRPPVILQVLPALVTGGVERGTIEITEAIVRAGGTALVTSGGGRLVPAIERAGGTHVTLPLATRDPCSIWLNGFRLARLIRARQVDIVHARSRAPAWSAYMAARRTGTHFVTTYHGAYSENVPLKRRYNAVMAKGERVIAISRFIAALIEERHKVPPERIAVIPRGVDCAVFDPDAVSPDRLARLARAWRLPDGAPTVTLPARLSRWKGQEVLIEALALLSRRDVCAVLVGSDQGRTRYSAGLARLAERRGVGDRLRLAGETDDMPAAYMLSDVVVHASTDPEPFGRVVIEAQAMGRPVIATDHGAPVETVEQDVTGWRVPPGDPAALARAIEHALALPEEARRAIGAQARAAVQAGYTTAAMQAATIDVYRTVLGH